MRRILNAALVLSGSFVGVTASPSTSPAKMDAKPSMIFTSPTN